MMTWLNINTETIQNQLTLSSNCDTKNCHTACLLECVILNTPHSLCKTSVNRATVLAVLESVRKFHLASGVSKVGVTRCANCWCHPIFSFKKWWPNISHRHHSHPIRLPSDRLSCVLCKRSRKNVRLSLWCPPPPSRMVSSGAICLPCPLPPSDATASRLFLQDTATYNIAKLCREG